MSKSKKSHWAIIAFVVILVSIIAPVIIHKLYTWLYQIDGKYCLDLMNKMPFEWTVLFGNYFSGIASLAMFIVAWKTLKSTILRNEEEDKPKIALSIVQVQENNYEIEVVNYGRKPATNLHLTLIIPENLRAQYSTYLISDRLEFRPNGLEILYPNVKVNKPLFRTNGQMMCLYGCIQCRLDSDLYSKILYYHSHTHLEVEYSHDDCTEPVSITLSFPFRFW